jgi:hypothetical protein
VTGALSDPSDVQGLQERVRLAKERVAAAEGAPADEQERTGALIELAVVQETLLGQLRGQRDSDDYEAIRVESDLGTTRFKLGDLQKALELREDVVDRLQRTSGPDDRATLVAEWLLADVVRATGDYTRVERIETDILAARVRVDPEGRDTDRARCALADTKRTLGKVRNAGDGQSRLVEEGGNRLDDRCSGHGSDLHVW